MAEITENVNTYAENTTTVLESKSLQPASLLDEWQKLLLRPVNVNASGHIISGILTQVRPDHIIVVGTSHVHIIPFQSVAFICYQIKS